MLKLLLMSAVPLELVAVDRPVRKELLIKMDRLAEVHGVSDDGAIYRCAAAGADRRVRRVDHTGQSAIAKQRHAGAGTRAVNLKRKDLCGIIIIDNAVSLHVDIAIGIDR